MPEDKYCKCGRPLAFDDSIATGRCSLCRNREGACESVTLEAKQFGPLSVGQLVRNLDECQQRERAAIVAGVGKDAPTVTNAAGGKQSHSPYRADLLPPHALLAVSAVLKEGADKYGANNWHKIPAADNVNHALVHLLALQAGDTSDEHLEHAATRILFALDQVRSGREQALQTAGAEKGGAA